MLKRDEIGFNSLCVSVFDTCICLKQLKGGVAVMYVTNKVTFYASVFSRKCLSCFLHQLQNLENLEKWKSIFQSGKSQGIGYLYFFNDLNFSDYEF